MASGTTPVATSSRRRSRSGYKKWLWAAAAFVAGSIAGPAVGRMLRPVFKGGVKGGIRAQQAVGGVIAGLREDAQDIVAEAKAELASDEQEATPHNGSVPHSHGTA